MRPFPSDDKETAQDKQLELLEYSTPPYETDYDFLAWATEPGIIEISHHMFDIVRLR